MNEQEYRAADGLNYSHLADFMVAPNVALMEREPKAYFEEGHAFERLLQDYASAGESAEFVKKFFILTNTTGSMPNELPAWIENSKQPSDLDQYYVWTKGGDRNKKYETRHTYLDACKENFGKLPLSQEVYDMLECMVENLLSIELFGLIMKDIMTDAQWQVPLFWEHAGIKKKCLIDCLATVQFNGKDTYIAIDVKSAATQAGFRSKFFQRYWVQDQHYLQGVEFALTGPYFPHMVFAVAYKEKPFLARPWISKEEMRPLRRDLYFAACEEWKGWNIAGRPKKGWQELERI